MKIFAAVAALCCAASLAQARPVVIQESARVPSPDSRFFLWKAAIEGDDMVAIGLYNFITDEIYSETESAAFLFHRTGTTWNFVRNLASGFDSGVDDAHPHYSIGMKNGVLATGIQPLYIFEKRNGDWVQVKTFGGDSDDVIIDNGRMFFGSLSWGGVVIERDAAGQWQGTQSLRGDNAGLGDAERGGSVGFVGNWASIFNEFNDGEDNLPTPAITLWRQTGASPTSWVQSERRVAAEGHTYGDIAMGHGPSGVDEMYLPDFLEFGTPVYRRSGTTWNEDQRLHSSGELMAGPFFGSRDTGEVTKSDGYLFRRVWDHDRDEYVGEVYQPDANGRYVHVATLVSSDGNGIGEVLGNGNRAVAGGNGNVMLVFDLPASFATPAVIQDTFATGNGAGWTAVPGSQWAVLQSGASRVYRQSNTAGDAGAVLDAADWTDQSIQADVTATAFNGNDRWVGLATRRADSANYYYVTLRASGTVALRRMRAGQFTTLASAPYPVSLNRAYRLRLESIGSQHRVYVDGVRVLEANDTQLTHGRAALLMYRAAADFDNVVLTPSDTATIYAAGEQFTTQPLNPRPWVYAGGSWTWAADGQNDNLVFSQFSVAGDARAAVGPLIDERDQVVEASVRLGTFGAGADPWFGVMARYVDERNYVYLSLRKSNTLSVRRLVNGQVTQLGSVAQTVTPGTWYRLRLDAIGDQLRAYVNGNLVLEATDPQPSGGRTGLVSYRTSADYDDYRAIRP